MQKRGQFFLIAALIASTILFGVGKVFTAVQTAKADQKAQLLADEITYEFSQLLDRGASLGLTQVDIERDILTLSGIYAKLNPKAEFIIIYGNSNIKSKYYLKGQELDFSANLTVNPSSIKVLYNSNIYEFQKHSGQTFHTIIKLENDYGKTIAIK